MKIGIDLGGSHIAIGLIDNNYEIIDEKEYYMNDKGNLTFEEYIINCINEGINEILLKNNLKIKEIEQIGIATPGNPVDGVIKNVVNMGIKIFNIKEEINKNFDVEVKVANDGKCAGLAEKEIGALKKYDDCVFLCVGTGIGGAAFLDGKMLKPKRNSGFEFGHMIINKNGKECKCGNLGCFEAYCSKRKLKNEILKILNVTNHVKAEELTKIVKAANNKDVEKLLNEYIENLEIGIANIVNILEPQAIAIGGSLSHYEELILNKVIKDFQDGKKLFNKENPPKIFPAEAGNKAGMIGAALL